MRALFVGAALCATASCTLFTSFGELSAGGGDPDAAASEGGPTGGEAGSDGGGGADGGDAGGGRFCASVDASFCEDFDDPTDTSFKNWIAFVETGGSVKRVDGGYSGPWALESAVKTSSSDQIAARLTRIFPNVKKARIAYRFRLEERDTNALVQFGQVEIDTAAGAESSIRMTTEGETDVEGAVYPAGGNGTFPNLSSTFTLTAGVWHSVDMTVDWQPSPAVLTFELDGQLVADKRAVVGSNFGPGNLSVHAGIYYLEGPSPGGWRTLVDDIVVWIE